VEHLASAELPTLTLMPAALGHAVDEPCARLALLCFAQPAMAVQRPAKLAEPDRGMVFERPVRCRLSC